MLYGNDSIGYEFGDPGVIRDLGVHEVDRDPGWQMPGVPAVATNRHESVCQVLNLAGHKVPPCTPPSLVEMRLEEPQLFIGPT